MSENVNRSKLMTFMDTTPTDTATWALVGDGVVTGKINYNPKTTEETYIHETNATTTIDSYAPELPVEQTAKVGDEVYDYIDSLRIDRATLTDAETNIVNVWAYMAATAGAYPAEKQKVAIAVEDFGGDGGAKVKINYSIKFLGDPIKGTFNPLTKVFTAA